MNGTARPPANDRCVRWNSTDPSATYLVIVSSAVNSGACSASFERRIESFGRPYCRLLSIDTAGARNTPARNCAPAAPPMRDPVAKSAKGSVPVLMFRVSSALRFPRSKPANAMTPPAISTDPRRGASDPLQICAAADAGHADTSSTTAVTTPQALILGALRHNLDFDV